jgi:hypothetical protein
MASMNYCGSLVGECYASVGFRLAVWCFRLRRLAIQGGGRCCAVSSISGLTCSLIVMCNLVYVTFIINVFLKVLIGLRNLNTIRIQ